MMEIRRSFKNDEESRAVIAQCIILLVKEHIEFTVEHDKLKVSVLAVDVPENRGWVCVEVLNM